MTNAICQVLYVKFDKAEWVLDGMVPGSNGIYPVVTRNETWHLDLKRKGSACLKVQRRQFPICLDYARSAYSMQGFTLKKAKVNP